MCAEHGVMKQVVGSTDVTMAALLSARRSAQPAWLTCDVRVAEDHPHDVHVQRPTSASTIVRCVYTTSNTGGLDDSSIQDSTQLNFIETYLQLNS